VVGVVSRLFDGEPTIRRFRLVLATVLIFALGLVVWPRLTATRYWTRV
jgi:hypothetical protein